MEDKTLYFQNGILYKISPNDGYNYYQARYFVSDGILYDFEDPEDIAKLPIPKFKRHDGLFNDVTKCLDYIVRMKAGDFYNRNERYLCTVCLRKMIELMEHSTIFWPERDYYRIVQWNIEMGNFEEADKAEIEINQFLNSSPKYIALRNSIVVTPEIIKDNQEYEQKNKDRKEYYRIFYSLPDFAPKSFGAYRRMKNANTKNFQKLLSIAKQHDINIEF